MLGKHMRCLALTLLQLLWDVIPTEGSRLDGSRVLDGHDQEKFIVGRMRIRVRDHPVGTLMARLCQRPTDLKESAHSRTPLGASTCEHDRDHILSVNGVPWRVN
jgi:hypothetical protein